MAREFSDELLSAFLDGEASPDERAAVEARLAADPEARQLLDELRVLSSEVQRLPRCAAGEGFAERVVQAALAAKADQNGYIQPAARGSQSHRTSAAAWWMTSLAGAGALAASLLIVAWSQGWLGTDSRPPEVVSRPNEPTAAQIAVARLRQAIPQEGHAVVIRLRLDTSDSPSQALDAALTKAGIGSRLATDTSTGAMSVAKAYRDKLAERFGGLEQGAANTAMNDGTTAAADAVFVEAPLAAIELAVAELAAEHQSKVELSSLMSVAVGRSTAEAGSEGEGDTAASKIGDGPKQYAQRLNAGLFRLDKEQPAAVASPVKAPIDAARPVRVLILIERASN